MIDQRGITRVQEYAAGLLAQESRSAEEDAWLFHLPLPIVDRFEDATVADAVRGLAAARADAAAELDAEASADTLPPTDVAAAFAEVPSHADEGEEDDIPPLEHP